MALEDEGVPVVAHEANPRDTQIVLRLLDRLECTGEHCGLWRSRLAATRASKLNLLDEPVALSQGDTSYRLIMQHVSKALVVRVERFDRQTRLVVKVTRGGDSWKPEVQTIRRRSRFLSEDEWQRLNETLRKYAFWNRTESLAPRPSKDGPRATGRVPVRFDGLNVSLEGVQADRYNLIRHSLDSNSEALQEVVGAFRELASCGPDDY